MNEVELYRAVTLILVAALGAVGIYVGKRTPAKVDPEQNKRENFDSMVEAMGKLLDRKDAEIAECKEEHRLECVTVNAAIAGLERDKMRRQDNEHRLNNHILAQNDRIQVLQLELDAERRRKGKLRRAPDENGDPQ